MVSGLGLTMDGHPNCSTSYRNSLISLCCAVSIFVASITFQINVLCKQTVRISLFTSKLYPKRKTKWASYNTSFIFSIEIETILWTSKGSLLTIPMTQGWQIMTTSLLLSFSKIYFILLSSMTYDMSSDKCNYYCYSFDWFRRRPSNLFKNDKHIK